MSLVDTSLPVCQVIMSYEVFGCIRSMTTFRTPGAKTDYLVIGSDSGRIVVLEYKKDINTFVKVHQETFGKSGCRRIVPGQHLAADPKGRACMIGAMEKQKLVYVLNRDSSAQLTISSPLEAHKSHNLCFDIVGMDMGYDNPVFAAIELDYAESDQVMWRNHPSSLQPVFPSMRTLMRSGENRGQKPNNKGRCVEHTGGAACWWWWGGFCLGQRWQTNRGSFVGNGCVREPSSSPLFHLPIVIDCWRFAAAGCDW